MRLPSTERLSVLVVEDEPLIAMHLKLCVEAFGHKVCGVAATADDAIELGLTHRPDVMLTDLRLRGGTSGEHAARVLFETIGLRAIFVSGNLDPDMRAQLSDLSPIAMIMKPFGIQEIERALSLVRPPPQS
ncbi:response regulator [Acuticoccus mangrovi]|uniref:Response regulator n=1 Tax=Acuticoccus mangrovi TaxID=2796142 RepID=A0A934MBX0_9HYPH|nr:response regulator [Acuticoccus mangrovi]MBJ3774612.1 response regulator [Acuticoccus mangrovi]